MNLEVETLRSAASTDSNQSQELQNQLENSETLRNALVRTCIVHVVCFVYGFLVLV